MIVIFIFAAFIIAAIAGMVYLVSRFRRFILADRWKDYWNDRRRLSWVVGAVPVLFLIAYCILDLVNGVIVTVNIVVIWLLADIVMGIIRRISKKKMSFYWPGVCAVIISAVYLGCGWYNAHNVVETDYQVRTAKDIDDGKLRIVQISDSHIGATFNGDGFTRHIDTIQKTNPDIVVITGDYVDDDTTKEDMIKSSEALGRLKTTYGVYYIYGNHDRGYFNSRDFDDKDMRTELARNNVKILQDESIDIGNNILLVGREDRSVKDRADMDTLLKDVDMNKYIIVLDHQPHDFDVQAEAGVDLVLCGHTHGGQMFPVGLTGEWTGANDKTYGIEKRKDTTFIVNSGISDWAIRYKTGGAIAEFGVIDVHN